MSADAVASLTAGMMNSLAARPTPTLEQLQGSTDAVQKIAFVIRGEPASKANSRQIVMMGKGPKARPAVIKSEKAREYEHHARLQIPDDAKAMLTGPVRVTLRVYYGSQRPDLDESVILDVLQAVYTKRVAGGTGPRILERRGVYLNDRQVREKHVFHAIDVKYPRTEIIVEALAPQQQGLGLEEPNSLGDDEDDPF